MVLRARDRRLHQWTALAAKVALRQASAVPRPKPSAERRALTSRREDATWHEHSHMSLETLPGMIRGELYREREDGGIILNRKDRAQYISVKPSGLGILHSCIVQTRHVTGPDTEKIKREGLDESWNERADFHRTSFYGHRLRCIYRHARKACRDWLQAHMSNGSTRKFRRRLHKSEWYNLEQWFSCFSLAVHVC